MFLFLLSDYSLKMTEKQEKILKAALSLFAKEGFAATSTSKVAKEAGVSEGLIFKHFGSKEGLLAAIMEQGAAAMKVVMADIVMTADPKEVIRKMLELPFHIDRAEYEMWRLIYALKWQTAQYDATMADPVRLVLKEAFTKLGYADPAAETELVFMLMDGAATSLLLHEPANKMDVLNSLKSKYQL
jgi:AcrR family transcriptional regulator